MAKLKDNAVTGIFIGVGAALVAPVVLPVLASIARPMAKTAMKGGVLLYERGREKFAETSEHFQDMAAEVKAELAEEEAERLKGFAAAAGASAAAGKEEGQPKQDGDPQENG